MPILLFAVVIGAAFLIAKKRQASNSALAVSSSNGTSTPETQNSSIPQLPSGASQLPGQIAAGATGAIIGAQAGDIITGVLGQQNAGEVVIAGRIAGGVAGAAIALAIVGVIAAPIAAIVLGVAVAAYSLVILISDLVRSSQGKTWAWEEYNKQREEMASKVFNSLRVNPDFVNKSDADLWRMAIPFADGFMRQLNKVEFRRFMNQQNVFRLFQSPYEHAYYGWTRGYFVGVPKNSGSTVILQDETIGDLSDTTAFALAYCPIEERVEVSSTTVNRYEPKDIDIAAVRASLGLPPIAITTQETEIVVEAAPAPAPVVVEAPREPIVIKREIIRDTRSGDYGP